MAKKVQLRLNDDLQKSVQKFVDYMNNEGSCDDELVWTLEIAVQVLLEDGLDKALKIRGL